MHPTGEALRQNAQRSESALFIFSHGAKMNVKEFETLMIARNAQLGKLDDFQIIMLALREIMRRIRKPGETFVDFSAVYLELQNRTQKERIPPLQ